MNEAIEALAKSLYSAGCLPTPDWEQLGEVTKSVWRERAADILETLGDLA